MKSLKLVWILLFLLGLAMEYAQGQQSQSRKAQLRASIKSADAFDQISADSVLAYAKAAEALLQEGDSLLLYYDVYRCLSRAYYRRNQKQEMRQASEKVLGYALEMKDSLLIARSYRSLAMAAPAVSNVEAKDFIQKALQYAQGSGADYKRIYMLSLQIQAYLIKYEDPQLAQSIRRQVLKTAIELKDSTLIGKTYETFGTYYRNFQVDSAIYYFSQARTLYQASGNKSFLASVYGKLGTCYQLKDEPDSVLLLAQNAYELGKETGTLSAQRAGLKLLIQHFSSQGDFTSALSYAEELLAIDEKKPSGYRSLIYLDIGEVYEKMGDKEQAQVYYGQALEQAMKDRYPPGIATARSNLGELAFQQGNLSEAKEQFSKVDAMYASMNIEAARVESFQRLGDIALLQTDFSEARSLFQNLLSTAEKLEDISAQANAHRGLASCDSAIGRPAEAFGHLNQYVALSDSFNRNNFNEKVAELQTKLETERKEAEIELLEQQARLQESELSQARSERNLYRTLGLAGLVILLVVGGFLLLLNKSRLQIKSQAEELLSLNQTKDDLFGIIAHDLKGPISGFQTLGRIFSHYLPEDSPKRLKQITQQLEQQSTHLNRL
ncbi:MAG: tetratricopeptide repeat protein, partial [Bacteroidota bacterium]